MATLHYFYVEAVDEFGEPDTGVTAVAVYKSSGSQLATLYTDRHAQTALTNPVTSTDLVNARGATFWTADSLVDVQITSAAGIGMRTSLRGESPRIQIPVTKAPLIVVKKTIGLFGDTTTDFTVDDASADTSEEVVDLGELIPAHAGMLDVFIKCTGAVLASTVAKTMSFTIGHSSSGDEYIAATEVDALNEIASVPAAGWGPVQPSVAAKNLYASMTPNANWSTLDDGARWTIVMSYIDYNAYF